MWNLGSGKILIRPAVCSNKANGNKLWEVRSGPTSAVPEIANYQFIKP